MLNNETPLMDLPPLALKEAPSAAIYMEDAVGCKTCAGLGENSSHQVLQGSLLGPEHTVCTRVRRTPTA